MGKPPGQAGPGWQWQGGSTSTTFEGIYSAHIAACLIRASCWSRMITFAGLNTGSSRLWEQTTARKECLDNLDWDPGSPAQTREGGLNFDNLQMNDNVQNIVPADHCTDTVMMTEFVTENKQKQDDFACNCSSLLIIAHSCYIIIRSLLHHCSLTVTSLLADHRIITALFANCYIIVSSLLHHC